VPFVQPIHVTGYNLGSRVFGAQRVKLFESDEYNLALDLDGIQRHARAPVIPARHIAA
jgi:hypothetical protein